MTTPKQYEAQVLAALEESLTELTGSIELVHQLFSKPVLTRWIARYTDLLVDLLENRSPKAVAKKIHKRVVESVRDPTEEEVQETAFELDLAATGRHWKGRRGAS